VHFLTAFIPTQQIQVFSTATAPAIPSVEAPTRIAAERTSVVATQVSDQVLSSGRVPAIGSLIPLGMVVWISGIVLALMLHVRAFRRMERTWKAAETYDPDQDEVLVLHTGRSGSSGRKPEIRVTSDLDVPVTLSGWTPRILLPAGYATLPASSRHLVLAHECAHVARRDLFLGWLPAASDLLFWFHPLARWAVREYAQAREEACDAAALERTQSSPRSYGQLLVHFGVAPRFIPSTASYGSPTRSALLRRLLMLDSTSSRWGRIAGGTLVVIAALSLAPLRLQAKDDGQHKGSPKTPAELEIEHFAYLLVEAGGKNMSGAMKMGDGYRDHERAKEAQRRMGGGRIWWFRLDRTQYGVDDAETLASVLAVLKEQDELHERTLAEFDHNLELLAGRMEGLHPKVERLDYKKAELEEELESLEKDGDDDKQTEAEVRRMAEIERSRAEIDRARVPLEQEQEEISKQMESLTERREAVSFEYEKQELELRAQLRRIAEDAVRRGVARKL
jgi:beta-lactamase regulating signal transducer with metallopeptidase domain